MNKTYDYNGVQIAQSRPVQKLRTVKKTIHIDSGDRDSGIYNKNGEFTVYLPRVYENVVSIRLKQAEFPTIASAYTFDKATNASAALSLSTLYFFMNFSGLNKSDEGASGADRSSFVDSVFSKFQVSSKADPIFYNESSDPNIIEYYRPAISKLDRLNVTTRLHGHTSNQYIYWSTNYSFSVEIEMLENSFDDFSSIETRIAERSPSGFFSS